MIRLPAVFPLDMRSVRFLIVGLVRCVVGLASCYVLTYYYGDWLGTCRGYICT